MRSTILAAGLAALAACGLPGAAGATITNPAAGGGMTANGTIGFTGNIVTTTCRTTLGGRVLSNVSVGFASGGAACGLGTLTFSFPMTATLDRLAGVLTGGFTITNVRATYEVTVAGLRCVYNGSIAGTYAATADAPLTITGHSLLLDGSSSPVLCSLDPTLTGTLQTNLTIA